ncbi:MAG: hypothetical protein V2A73_13085 [Pseudomonadota bacterium]
MSSQLFDNTVCLAVTFHRVGRHRRVRRGEVEIVPAFASRWPEEKPDQSRFTIGKQIFASDHYHKAERIAHDFDSWMQRRAVPCPLKRGTNLIPIAMLDEVYARLDKAQAEYGTEADALLAEYDELKQEAQRGLKGLYREEDYPLPERLRAAFWVERRMFDFSPPGEAKLTEAVYRQERERWQQTFAEAEDEVRMALRESMLTLVSHLAERLQPSLDGKKRVLRDSAVDKVVEFLELFDRRNVLNDDELKALVVRARRVLDGDVAMADALRQDGTVREIVRRRMEEVKSRLDVLVKSGPARVVSFEEED